MQRITNAKRLTRGGRAIPELESDEHGQRED